MGNKMMVIEGIPNRENVKTYFQMLQDMFEDPRTSLIQNIGDLLPHTHTGTHSSPVRVVVADRKKK